MSKERDEDFSERRVCTGCQLHAPQTQTNYTLISASHGWRLSTRFDSKGTRIAEWRCPACWAKYRQLGGKLMEAK